MKLVTFDAFSAFADLRASLQVYCKNNDSIDNVIQSYISYTGHTFTPEETQGLMPFQYVIKHAIPSIDRLDIIKGFTNLVPRQKAVDLINKYNSEGIAIGILSNGDKETLDNISAKFPDIKFQIFCSDYPIGCFKPCKKMYMQLLDYYDIDDILHIAGSEYDKKGAESVGIKSILIEDLIL